MLSFGAAAAAAGCGKPFSPLRLATFEADITPPLGTPYLGGVRARSTVDPLYAKGLVLLSEGQLPVVLAALDWCEIRNDSYDTWRDALAESAGTTRDRVLLHCVHQHDAPYVDETAQRLLKEAGVEGDLCHPEANAASRGAVAAAIRNAVDGAGPISHLGTGLAETTKLVSNRRYLAEDGRVSWGRTSATRDPRLRALPPGLVDPYVRTLSFWSGERPIAAVHCFSIHPMSYYGDGDTSADFPGIARARMQRELPGVFQIYMSGCSGDTIAGVYNDGSPEMRAVLADRLYQGMRGAWEATEPKPLERVGFRKTELRFQPRRSPGFSVEEMRQRLTETGRPFRELYPAALGLSWRLRLDEGRPIDLPCLDFGVAQLALAPAEAFVQYQLWAQELRPDSFVIAAGYGECAPGYIPTAKDAAEGYDDSYSWVAFPECEAVIREGLARVLTSGQDLSPPPSVTDPQDPLMLRLPDAGTDPSAVDFEALPRVPCRRAAIDDVRDRGGRWVNQHAYLARFRDRYWAMWSDGPGVPRDGVSPEDHRNVVPGHDQAGTRVSFATSEDGVQWSEPGDLSGPPRIEGFGWIARGYWVRDGELLALAAHFRAPGYPGPGLSLEAFRWDETAGKWAAYGTVLDDSMNNFPPKRLPNGLWMMTRRDHQRQVSVMIGGVDGFDDWEVHPMAAYDGSGRPEEPYWYVLPDGESLAGLIRDNGGSRRLLRTFSTDNGQTWSKIVVTNFPDARSKFFVLRTSRGYYAMVSNANPARRDPLVLSIGEDGLVYTRMFYLVGGRHVDYPHMIEHDGHLLIAFSGAKQTMEVLEVSLDDVDALRMQPFP